MGYLEGEKERTAATAAAAAAATVKVQEYMKRRHPSAFEFAPH